MATKAAATQYVTDFGFFLLVLTIASVSFSSESSIPALVRSLSCFSYLELISTAALLYL